MTGKVQDNVWPVPKFYFTVKFDSQENTAVFQEVAGLDIENQSLDFRIHQFSMIKLPGIERSGTVTLKKGIFGKDNDIFNWINAIKKNTIKRETVTIQLMDEQGNPTITWKLLNAWPTIISGTDLKSEGNEVSIETLELAHEGITIENK